MMSIFLDFADLCSFVALFSWLLVVGSRDVSTFIASTHYPLFIRNWLVNPRTILGHMADRPLFFLHVNHTLLVETSLLYESSRRKPG